MEFQTFKVFGGTVLLLIVVAIGFNNCSNYQPAQFKDDPGAIQSVQQAAQFQKSSIRSVSYYNYHLPEHSELSSRTIDGDLIEFNKKEDGSITVGLHAKKDGITQAHLDAPFFLDREAFTCRIDASISPTRFNKWVDQLWQSRFSVASPCTGEGNSRVCETVMDWPAIEVITVSDAPPERSDAEMRLYLSRDTLNPYDEQKNVLLDHSVKHEIVRYIEKLKTSHNCVMPAPPVSQEDFINRYDEFYGK